MKDVSLFFLEEEFGTIERTNLKECTFMIHQNWKDRPTIKEIKCVHTNASKYMVENVLSVNKTYEVKNETEEFYFVVDNTGKVGGYYKEYFEE